MQLQNSYKPNYFFYAQRFMHLVQQKLQKHPEETDISLRLQDIYDHFGQDFAASSTSLEGILNIADEYRIETIDGDQKIIQSYHIDATENTLHLRLIPEVSNTNNLNIQWLTPDPTRYE